MLDCCFHFICRRLSWPILAVLLMQTICGTVKRNLCSPHCMATLRLHVWNQHVSFIEV